MFGKDDNEECIPDYEKGALLCRRGKNKVLIYITKEGVKPGPTSGDPKVIDEMLVSMKNRIKIKGKDHFFD